jgi:predicted alpha/beta-fold hydrolase
MQVFVVVEHGYEGGFMVAFQEREAAEQFAARWHGIVFETRLCTTFAEGEAEYFGEEA